MTKVLLIGSGPMLARAQQLIEQNAQYVLAGIVGDATGYGQVPVYTGLDEVPASDRQHLAAFIVGDQQLLNQERLSAYMDVKKQGLPVMALVSAHAVIASDTRLRENVFIDDQVRILPRANIGANSVVLQGTEIGEGAKLGSSCWIGRHCVIGEGASIGKNCTLGDGVTIAPGVVLPTWSTINVPTSVASTPATTLFLDSRFRAPVFLFDKPSPRH